MDPDFELQFMPVVAFFSFVRIRDFFFLVEISWRFLFDLVFRFYGILYLKFYFFNIRIIEVYKNLFLKS